VYTESVRKDVWLFIKACLSNQLARWTPALYVRLTHQTGRGSNEEGAREIADYFTTCFRDYREQLGVSEEGICALLSGKTVLEYGPGDILGVALLFYAHGAEAVHCVDRFPLSSLSDKNVEVYRVILDALEGEPRERAEGAFVIKGEPRSGFRPEAIRYDVTRDGLCGIAQGYDLVVSRAVLEHVNDLEKTMIDIRRSLKSTGLSLHQVDLKSHGLDRYTELDFLTWPRALYSLMYSHKGFPNRWRVNRYRELAEKHGLEVRKLTPTARIDAAKVEKILPALAPEFRNVSADHLQWTGFWIHLATR